jgi:hypothetical protein
MFEISTQSLTGSHQFLFMDHPSARIFQAQAKVEGTWAFRPYSLSSSTHQKLRANVLARHQKTQKTKFLGSLDNPERQKAELEKVSA